jgi:Na+-translocating ferredoxin:NAD+ oxidoreductase RnfG subunit
MSRPDSPFGWAAAAVVGATLLPAQLAIASSYLTTEAAQRLLFPAADKFEPLHVAPTADQLTAIAKAAGQQAPHGKLLVWTAKQGNTVLGHVFVDEVVGREDFITYAAGIDARGALLPPEILDYRESHGAEIRNKRWLAQFAGRHSPDALRFRTDIKNIAGATLSSEHVTAGVRRLLVLWQMVIKPPAAAE